MNIEKRGPLKGLVLAAGLGSRLRPLTNKTAKPLLPFFNIPILYLALCKFKMANIESVAANGHHNHEVLEKYLLKNPVYDDVFFSYEKNLLGSGGVYGNLKSWLDGSDLIAFNGDIVTDFSLSQLIEEHYGSHFGSKVSPLASLGLINGKNPRGNSIWIDENHTIISIEKEFTKNIKGPVKPFMFSGIQILSAKFTVDVKENTELDLIERFRHLIDKGELLKGFHQDCFWHDLGTPYGFFECHKNFCELLFKEYDCKQFDETGISLGLKAMDEKLTITYDKGQLNSSLKNLIANSSSLGIDFVSNQDMNFDCSGPNVFGNNASFNPHCKLGPNCFLSSDTNIDGQCSISDSVFFDQKNHALSGDHHKIIAMGELFVPFVAPPNTRKSD